MIMSLVKNLPTKWQEIEEENQFDQLMKNSPNPDGKLRKKIDNCWRRDIDGKLVKEKSPGSEGVLERKSTPYDWGFKKTRESSQVWD